MRKFLTATAMLSLFAAAGAQVINPTDTNKDQVNRGTTTATVTQTVNLKLPQATALHLDAADLVFDISKLKEMDGSWYCAYGLGADQTTQLGADFWNQKQVLPLGTSYTPDPAKFGQIRINAGAKVTDYPPAIIKDGEVDNATKAYFVCYRSFIIQKFSNLGNFKMTVTRDNPAGDMGHQLMYIQDNPCDFWTQSTGLYHLPNGATRELIPMSMTKGTTGARAAAASKATAGKAGTPATPAYCRAYTSWLDDLVVVAVVVDGDKAGDNIATLTYTLESSASAFTLADSDAKN
ncbi:hypothetical protein D3875_08880 [Deinococcus cavernae]|uniref:Uncharacterized protein n=1 Tax=Deinococcus cavernae TaxID=2320857 RepID=A0A418V6G4_9DEIO|nr:hypothetical protein [Deinococcus cavernae]RJF71666.1 hypothetical protein D3875_08880 [Deinococcus cavernae]